MHLEAAYLVGLIRGLLPKRNDGRSSETVPFRRRNFSVRSKPADGVYKEMCYKILKGQFPRIQAETDL